MNRGAALVAACCTVAAVGTAAYCFRREPGRVALSSDVTSWADDAGTSTIRPLAKTTESLVMARNGEAVIRVSMDDRVFVHGTEIVRTAANHDLFDALVEWAHAMDSARPKGPSL